MKNAKKIAPKNGDSSQEREKTDLIVPSELIPMVQPGEKALVPYDPLQMYLLEIKNYELLTREEEVELGIRVREKNDRRPHIDWLHQI